MKKPLTAVAAKSTARVLKPTADQLGVARTLTAKTPESAAPADALDRIVLEQQNALTRGRRYHEKANDDAVDVNPEMERMITRDRPPGSSGGSGGSRGRTVTKKMYARPLRADPGPEKIRTRPFTLGLRPEYRAALEAARSRCDVDERDKIRIEEHLRFVSTNFAFVLRTLPSHVRYGDPAGVVLVDIDRADFDDSGKLVDVRDTERPVIRSSPKPRKYKRSVFAWQKVEKLKSTRFSERFFVEHNIFYSPPPTSSIGSRSELDTSRIDLALRIDAAEIRLQLGRVGNAQATPDRDRVPTAKEDANALISVTREVFERMQIAVPGELATLRTEARGLYDDGMPCHRIAAVLHQRDGRHIWTSNVVASFIEVDLWAKPRIVMMREKTEGRRKSAERKE